MQTERRPVVLLERIPWISNLQKDASIPMTPNMSSKQNMEAESKEDDILYYCCICYKLFERKKHLRRHFSSHTGDCDHECEFCHRCYSSKDQLNSHLLDSHEVKQQSKTKICRRCDKVFATEETLHLHLYNIHKLFDSPVRYSCKICHTAFHRKANLNLHIKKTNHKMKLTDQQTKVDNKKDYENETVSDKRCTECNKIFSDYVNLNIHMYNVHKIKSPSLKHFCHKCDIAFKWWKGLLSHNKIHKSSSTATASIKPSAEKQKECTSGILIDKSQDNIIKSQIESSIICAKCGKSFSSIVNLNIHCYNAHQMFQTRVTFKCELCKKAFMSSENLDQHNQSFHAQIEPLTHNVDIDALPSETMETKRECKSNQEANNLCSICFKRFRWPYELNIHRYNIHKMFNTAVSYQCKACHRAFETEASLKRHNSIRHSSKSAIKHRTGPKIHSSNNKNRNIFDDIGSAIGGKNSNSSTCQICHQTFRDPNRMLVHQYNLHGMLHLKVGHKCDICKKAFRGRWEFRKHNKTAHKIVTPKKGDPGRGSCRVLDKSTAGHSTEEFPLQIKSEDSSESNSSTTSKRRNKFFCGNCDKSFNSKVMLYIHEHEIHKSLLHYSPEQYDICLPIDSKLKLEQATTTSPVKQVDISSSDLNNNEDNSKLSMNEEQVCSLCDKRFIRTIQYRLHRHNVHQISDPTLRWFCGSCNKAFDCIAHLADHMVAHSGKTSTRCTICNVIPEKVSLRDHIRATHSTTSSSDNSPTEDQLESSKPSDIERNGLDDVLNEICSDNEVDLDFSTPTKPAQSIHQFYDGSPPLSYRFNPVLSELSDKSPSKPSNLLEDCSETANDANILTREDLLAEEHNYANSITDIAPIFADQLGDVNDWTDDVNSQQQRVYCLKRLTAIRKNKMHPCHLCRRQFRNRCLLNIHLYNAHQIVHNFVTYRCLTCCTAFDTEKKLAQHKRTCHRQSKFLRRCKIHGENAVSNNISDGIQNSLLSCSICMKGFKFEKLLIRHLKHFHSILLPVDLTECYLCGIRLSASLPGGIL